MYANFSCGCLQTHKIFKNSMVVTKYTRVTRSHASMYVAMHMNSDSGKPKKSYEIHQYKYAQVTVDQFM